MNQNRDELLSFHQELDAGEPIVMLDTSKQRRRTLDYIQRTPNVAETLLGVRKRKTRLMLDALVKGRAEAGNHFISYYDYLFEFFYRGTLIYKWHAVEDQGSAPDAMQYEGTASTQNQRREIQKAIENFNGTVLRQWQF